MNMLLQYPYPFFKLISISIFYMNIHVLFISNKTKFPLNTHLAILNWIPITHNLNSK